MLIKNPSAKTKNYLKTFIKFDPNSETNFTWAQNRGRRMKAGDRAGTFSPDGYVVLSDGNYGKLLGHNVAYYLKNGKWPKKYQADTFRKEFEKVLKQTGPLDGLDNYDVYESREEALLELSSQMDLNYLIYSSNFYTEAELKSVSKMTSFELPQPTATNDSGLNLYYGEDILSYGNNMFAFTNLLDVSLPDDVFYIS